MIGYIDLHISGRIGKDWYTDLILNLFQNCFFVEKK